MNTNIFTKRWNMNTVTAMTNIINITMTLNYWPKRTVTCIVTSRCVTRIRIILTSTIGTRTDQKEQTGTA